MVVQRTWYKAECREKQRVERSRDQRGLVADTERSREQRSLVVDTERDQL